MKKPVVVGGLLTLVCIAVGILLADYYRAVPDDVEARFIGRESCAECHQQQVTLFQGSDHDLAMDLATPETVLANFDDQTLEHYGVTSRMYRAGDRYMVTTDGPDGELQDFEVKYVFGVRPLQQYMVELERPSDAEDHEVGRVQVLRLSWDTNRKKWFYLMPPDVDEHLEPDDPLHWTGITQNWNASCAVCHSTDLHKNYNPLTAQYHTTFSEIDVSCEACHGPASYHVELARRRSLFWDRQHGFGLAKLKVDDNRPQVETCAPCHSRRTMASESFRPGCNFDDYFATQLIEEPVYHADGQVRDEDYVYGSFIQSKMYHNDVKCSDCHDPHSAKVKFTDNRLCTSCHQHPAGKYDTPNHHHHAPGTPGSNCVDCHMPATTYMMVDARRDHSFRVPRPDLSLQLGTPNACSGCHIDASRLTERTSKLPLRQYLDWIIAAESGDEVVAAELKRVNEHMQLAVESWFPPAEAADKTAYYADLAIGLSNLENSLPSLLKLANDSRVPDMIRASALVGLAADDTPESLEEAMQAVQDDSVKVVIAALRRIDAEINREGDRLRYAEPGANRIQRFKPLAQPVVELLDHASPRVRAEAARVFSTLDDETRQATTNARQRKSYASAIREFERSLLVNNDRASTHMMLGSLHELRGDYEQAKNDYRNAIAAEPNLSGPRSNLAALLEQETMAMQNRLQSAPQQGIAAGDLRAGLEQLQQQRLAIARLRAEEYELLANDVRRSEGLSGTHGLHYRFAMASYLQGNMEATEKHLLLAAEQEPEIPTYLLGLATYYLQAGQPTDALKYIQSLLEQDPQHPGYLNLESQAKAQLPKSSD